jgi:rhodanese-related sulfurtransferase
VQAQAASSIATSLAPDGAQIIDIRNVSFEVTNSHIPGRPADERLLLRKTVHSKETVGDIGMEAGVTLDAWKFGDDPRNKPLYTLNATGAEGHTQDSALFVVARGLEEVRWWSVYKLGNGQRLMDTYVPLIDFSISRDTVTPRYAGLEVPPDDTSDARLKQPNVIGVLTYASADRVLREALVTSDDREQAALLRSFADVTRTLSIEERERAAGTVAKTGAKPGDKAQEPARMLKVSFRQDYPSPPNALSVVIPVVGDDLDLAHAQLPAKVHVAAWKR